MSVRIVRRRDSGTLAKPVRTEDGFLRVDGVIARCGILEYANPDGTTRRELVTPEELFDPESIKSFAVLALTNTHPDELLTPETVKEHIVGTVGEPRREGTDLASLLGVLTADAIKAVEEGRAELSCGYQAEVDDTPGESVEWGPYDGIQRKRRGNHVAIVDMARAGHGARMRLDAAGNVAPGFGAGKDPVVPLDRVPPLPAETPMKIRIDGKDIELNDANAVTIQQLVESQASALQGRIDAAATAATETTKKLDAIKAKIADGKKALRANLKRLIGKFDAMKARMMPCDGCSGSGKMMDGEAEKKCDYCDGTVRVRMHDAIKEEPIAEEMEELASELEHGEGVEDDAVAGMLDDPGTPEPVVAAERKDAKIVAAVVALSKRRRDAITRVVKRDASAQLAFDTGARKVLGADAKLDGKTQDEVRRLVLGKIKPALKLDGKDGAFVAVAYELAIAEAPAGAGGGEGGGGEGGGGSGAHNDGDAFDVGKAQKAYNDNLKSATKGRPATAAQ